MSEERIYTIASLRKDLYEANKRILDLEYQLDKLGLDKTSNDEDYIELSSKIGGLEIMLELWEERNRENIDLIENLQKQINIAKEALTTLTNSSVVSFTSENDPLIHCVKEKLLIANIALKQIEDIANES